MNRPISSFLGIVIIGFFSLGALVVGLVIINEDTSSHRITNPISHVPSKAALAATTSASNSIYFEPGSTTVAVGDEFSVAVRSNTNTSVNAVQAFITYPTNLLTVSSINPAGSGFAFTIEEKASNGTITISKGTTPAVSGDQLVTTIIFKAKAVGAASLVVTQDSALVAADAQTGATSNVLSTFGTGNITIVDQETIPSLTPTATTTPLLTPSPTSIPLMGFKGEYFNNKMLSGNASLIRYDTAINFNWRNGSPSSSIPSDKFSVRWTKQQSFDSGTYKFVVRHDDGFKVYLDGGLIYESWSNQSARKHSFKKDIKAGIHTITVEYFEDRGKAVAQLNWEKIR